MKGKITKPLKWHGGKEYLAPKILALMPPRCANTNAPASDDAGWLHYVEPYFGGGSVLLANDPVGISEVVNDKNVELTNFWRVLQDKDQCGEFVRIINMVPFSDHEYRNACQLRDGVADVVEAACRFFVRCRQSLSGRMKGFAGITRNRTRKGMNEQVSAWLNCIEGLPAVHERLKRVLILNDDALTVIRKEDGPRTLFYLDPPYLHETRATTTEYGENEMSEQEHVELLLALDKIQGRFLLSGYRSKLYDNHAKTRGWNRHDFDLPNNAAGGKGKRRMTECVWCNY